MSSEPDGILKGYSPALRLSLCWENEMLRLYDPEMGDYLRNFEAEQAARERAEAMVRELQQELKRRNRES